MAPRSPPGKGRRLMHLAELLTRRAVPAAAVFAVLTSRCPLACRHCSTDSGPRGADLPEEVLTAFVGSFGRSAPPEFLLLTGGEPLLRPELVVRLAGLARAAGTRSYLLTGGYF